MLVCILSLDYVQALARWEGTDIEQLCGEEVLLACGLFFFDGTAWSCNGEHTYFKAPPEGHSKVRKIQKSWGDCDADALLSHDFSVQKLWVLRKLRVPSTGIQGFYKENIELRVSQNGGYNFGSPSSKDYDIWESIFGSPISRNPKP